MHFLFGGKNHQNHVQVPNCSSERNQIVAALSADGNMLSVFTHSTNEDRKIIQGEMSKI